MKDESQLTAAYKILDEYKLIIHVYQGTGTTKSMLNYFNFMLDKLEKEQVNYSILIDSRKMNWDFLITEVNDYIKSISDIVRFASLDRKIAGIYSISPHHQIYTKQLHRALVEAGQNDGYFTDIPSAIDWLEVQITPEEAEQAITDISKNPQFIWEG